CASFDHQNTRPYGDWYFANSRKTLAKAPEYQTAVAAISTGFAPPPTIEFLGGVVPKNSRRRSDRHSHNPARPVPPVAIPQQALVELAGRQPRQLGLEIDRPRHLLPRQVFYAERDQLLRDLRPRRHVGHQLHDRLHLLAEILVG